MQRLVHAWHDFKLTWTEEERSNGVYPFFSQEQSEFYIRPNGSLKGDYTTLEMIKVHPHWWRDATSNLHATVYSNETRLSLLRPKRCFRKQNPVIASTAQEFFDKYELAKKQGLKRPYERALEMIHEAELLLSKSSDAYSLREEGNIIYLASDTT